jgi:hypothetical protein
MSVAGWLERRVGNEDVGVVGGCAAALGTAAGVLWLFSKLIPFWLGLFSP